MQLNHTRATSADHPPSPAGAPAGRATRWPFRAGIVAIAGVALAAPMVAAEPAAGPRRPAVAPAAPARPVKAIDRFVEPQDEFQRIAQVALLASVVAAGEADEPLPEPPPPPPPPPTPTTTAPPPPPPPTTTTTAPPPPPPPPTTTTPPPPPPPTTTTTAPPPPPPTTAAPAPRSPEPAAPVGASGGNWDRLAQCESGGNWAINTGNGYYGGLQFSASSWQAVGGSGLPHQASRETQIAMGERLKASQGWGAWPSCSAKLGLR